MKYKELLDCASKLGISNKLITIWIPEDKYVDAHFSGDSLSITRESDPFYGMAFGPSPLIDSRWTHFSCTRSTPKAITENVPLSGQWDAYGIETKNFDICGFRINYFDIPWVLHKLHKYGIEPANMIYLYDKKPWDLRVVDMSDDWKQKFAWAFSFDEMCYELGVKSPKDVMNGSMVHQYFYQGKIEMIKEYCEKDVSSSIDAAKKLYK